MDTKPRVIAVIPCYNTESFIARVVGKAKEYVDEVIVVDDGSQDRTAEVAKAAGATVLRHGKNLGKGAAMKTAVQNADADVIVFIDGDDQHNPAEIPEVVSPILQGKADFVIGSRHLPGSKVSSPSFIRRFTNVLASFAISATVSFLLPLATGLSRLVHPKRWRVAKPRPTNQGPRAKKWITDCTSGFRAIKKEGWQKLDLISSGFQIETEMIYEAAKNGLVIAEVPISCNWKSNLSRLSILRDGLVTLRLLSRKLINSI